MSGYEMDYIHQAFETNWISPFGPNINAFEHDLEVYLNENNHVAALSSGTSAIHLSLIVLNVGQGDEVICQSKTFSASANPIVYLGATPIFVDSEKDTWNICPEQLEKAIRDRISKGKTPKTIASMQSQSSFVKSICDIMPLELRVYRGSILGGGEFVNQILKEAEERHLHQLKNKRAGKTIENIIKEECRRSAINPLELRGGGKRRVVSASRANIAKRGRDELGLSSAAIARHVGVSTSAITKAIERTEKGVS